MPKKQVLNAVITTQHNPNIILTFCGLYFPTSLQITVLAKVCTGNKRLSMCPLGHSMEHYIKSWNLKRLSRQEILTQNHTILCSVKLSLAKFVVTERTKLSISLHGRFLNRVVQRLCSEEGWMNEWMKIWMNQ